MKERRYRILVTGYAISSYGTYLNLVALNLYVYAVTDRALAVGVFMAVRLAAGFLAGLGAAALLARCAAKPVMFWANVVQAAALVLLVCAPDGLRTAALFLVSAVVGGAGTFFMVAFRSSIPDMVDEGRHTWANSLMVSGRSMAMVVGFASSGVVVSLLGYTAAFLVDMATFLVCAGTVALLPLTARPDREEKGAPAAAGGKKRNPGALAALATAPVIALMVALRGIDALGSSSHNAALPVYSTQLDADRPAVFVSVFWCVWALGNVLVQQVLQRWVKRDGRSVGALGFGLGTIAMSATFILAFAGFPWAATIVIALLAGAADGVTEVSYSSHLQTLPTGLRTHAFGLSATVENLGFGVGMIAVAAALDVFSPLSVVGVAHGVAIVVAVVFVAQTLRQRRSDPVSPEEGGGDAGPARGGRRDGAEVSGS
ncbi:MULTISPECIES: MFS transporter [unclassified Streptomyces]|uniref:MFS transporter n=1 Tax=unclassified Streptomyces TaxID=2593676 RepID=UPI000DBA9E25|nr:MULTISPECIES: MFS transporter [unclassified Streptomyces]MYT74069.1 MFS transporter [Streptomyces sp. SID8367]RAJ89486.1 putative MFS family arabinose efflux permease [Streptomyces sp. PsTaAH-137]